MLTGSCAPQHCIDAHENVYVMSEKTECNGVLRWSYDAKRASRYLQSSGRSSADICVWCPKKLTLEPRTNQWGFYRTYSGMQF